MTEQTPGQQAQDAAFREWWKSTEPRRFPLTEEGIKAALANVERQRAEREEGE